MTRMTGPDCVVRCNLINTYIHAYIHTHKRKKPQNSCRRRAGNGRYTGGWEKNVEKRGLVQ